MLLADDETRIGPHLLGRFPSTPDARDWTPDQLHERVEQVAREHLTTTATDRTLSWSDILARLEAIVDWIRHHLTPPEPVPPAPPPPAPPGPTDAPAWEDLIVLDQGNYGTCVGNGWAGWGNAAPIEDSLAEKDARAIYYEATVIDGQPDNPDAPGGGQQGSTVRSGAIACQNRKYLVAYAFAATTDDIVEWLDNHGSVVFGTDWTNGMFSPDHNGFIAPTGPVEGGHCYLCLGYDPTEDAFLFQNSWGTGWGLNGRFKMKAADVRTLLSQQGEACLAVETPHS